MVSEKNAQGFSESREEYLLRLHTPLQKIVLLFCAPVTLYSFGMWYYVNPAWQSGILIFADCCMVCAWFVGYWLLKKGKLSESVSVFITPVVIQAGLVFLLLDGAGVSALWSGLAATVYAGLFSKRKLFFSAVATVTFSIMGNIVTTFDLYPKQDASVVGALLPLIAMNVMTCSVMIYFLRKSQIINEKLFENIAEKSTNQERVIKTFKEMQPAVAGAVTNINGIASTIATQALEQATATDEINVTMDFIKGLAVDTNSAAAETLKMAQNTREQSLGSSVLVRASEQKFENVNRVVAESAKKTTDLANQLDRIDDILAFNRQIGQQLQVLAINAAIEADCAGDYGKGFGAVVAEFKEMVQNTEENLKRSTVLLRGIRDQSRESAQTIIDGSSQLTQYFQDLQMTGQTIERNADSFLRTSDSVASISHSARQQQSSISQVSVAMGQLTEAATHLQTSTQQMLVELDKITQSQTQLQVMLEEIQGEEERVL